MQTAPTLLEAKIDALRKVVGPACEGVSDRALEAILERTDDVDLATTALTMIPRPQWVERLISA